MKRQRVNVMIACGIFVLSFSLRYGGYLARAPFDWDQNRDYGEVHKIVQGETVVLGPVAKGAGGFYLGSLYYYMLTPAYLISGGSPRSLPVSSIVIDSLTAVLIFGVLCKLKGQKIALYGAVLWAFSWFIIDNSRVSWNAALIPAWTVLTLYTLVAIVQDTSKRAFYALGLLAGLSFHIHVSLIPVIPVISLFFIRSFRYRFRDWLFAACMAVLPLIPLILYDLTHGFMNLKLARSLISYQSSFKVPWDEMVIMAVTKLGKVVRGLLFARFADSLAIGCITLIGGILAIVQKKNLLIRLAGIILLTSFSLVVALHDIGFPEYYFGVGYIAVILLFVHVLRSLKWAGMMAILLVLIVNVRAYSSEGTPFSLGVKENIVNSLDPAKPLDVRVSVAPGREGGFGYLMERRGIVSDRSAKTKVLITDNVESPAFIDGELAVDTFRSGFIKTSIYVVQ